MTRWVDFWLDKRLRGDWQLPASRLRGFRLIGGALIGAGDELRFVPNTLEVRCGARALRFSRSSVVSATMGRRRLRIQLEDGARLSFLVNRRRLALNLLGTLLDD